jgi:deoxyribodipyrimidine photolyase-related protein
VYWAHMPAYTEANALGHQRTLPGWFWTGDTRLATKPYAASASYIGRMSDHCQGCAYSAKVKTGTGTGKDTGIEACPFNALYWDFFLRHAERLRPNVRLALVYRQLDRISAADKNALQAQAQVNLARIDTL